MIYSIIFFCVSFPFRPFVLRLQYANELFGLIFIDFPFEIYRISFHYLIFSFLPSSSPDSRLILIRRPPRMCGSAANKDDDDDPRRQRRIQTRRWKRLIVSNEFHALNASYLVICATRILSRPCHVRYAPLALAMCATRHLCSVLWCQKINIDKKIKIQKIKIKKYWLFSCLISCIPRIYSNARFVVTILVGYIYIYVYTVRLVHDDEKTDLIVWELVFDDVSRIRILLSSTISFMRQSRPSVLDGFSGVSRVKSCGWPFR